jgi:hypothetical protein
MVSTVALRSTTGWAEPPGCGAAVSGNTAVIEKTLHCEELMRTLVR